MPWSDCEQQFDLAQCLDGSFPLDDLSPFSPTSPVLLDPDSPIGSTSTDASLSLSLTELDVASDPLVESTPIPSMSLEMPPMIGPTTRQVQGSAFLLTWSQSPMLNRVMIQMHLETLGNVASLVVGKESHQDGGIHFHAMVIYQDRIRKSPLAFRILNRTADVRVANARVGTYRQSLVNMWNYVIKSDSEPLIIGDPPSAEPSGSKRKRDEIFSEAISIAQSTSVSEAIAHLLTTLPFDTVTRMDQIERALVTIRARSVQIQTPARPLTDFPKAPSIPADWKVLFINGPTGLGKTQWARALMPEATVVSHTDQLRTVDFSKGVIFDDFGVSHWPASALIHLLDWDEPRGINIKHGHVVIPPHTRKIFTFNSPFHSWVSKDVNDDQLAAMRRRVHVIDLYESLY